MTRDCGALLPIQTHCLIEAINMLSQVLLYFVCERQTEECAELNEGSFKYNQKGY